jgi:putative transposase
MSRGDRREDILHDDHDRRTFVETLAQTCVKTGWQVHAWCLMRNHFHLVIETPQPNLVAGMQWFLGTYTARFNRRHKLFGHLFSGRYKSLIVDGSGAGYLKTVCDYVHLNPVRAGLIQPRQSLHAYPWSSYGQYPKPPSRRWPWLRVDRLFGEWGIRKDDRPGRRQFQTLMEQRRAGDAADLRELRCGWCWGGRTFREKLLALIGGEIGEHHYGQETQESALEKGERLVREELRRANLTEKDLSLRRKGDPFKVRVAVRLREQTTVGWRWIANRLHMGHWRAAANSVLLYRKKTK